LAESIDYTRRREAFGKKLIDQPVVKHKIAHMASPTASPPRT
jgi:alkylation response protein AidB-like acyl-CoA dehydrogenase